MWKLIEIQIENIVSFHHAELNIEQGVATLIFGKNEDNAAQPCNGSGKSSLVEAISFAITGEQLRKVKSIEEIINDQEDKASVFVRLINDYDGSIFTIERIISRNSPQNIFCHKYDSDGVEIETDKTIQPSVNEYNKFILNELGVSKDDFYNFYILCDNKFESFFDCSDKNKKEIINRFSNGVIIDESIERLQEDLVPAQEDLAQKQSKVTNIEGSISAIETELVHADEKKAQAKEDRQKQIEYLDWKISQCRTDINIQNTNIGLAEGRLKILQDVRGRISEMENCQDMSLFEAYEHIRTIFEDNDLGSLQDYYELSSQLKYQLADAVKKVEEQQQLIDEWDIDVEQLKSNHKACSDLFAKHLKENARQDEDAENRKKAIEKELKAIDAKIISLEKSFKANKACRSELETMIARNAALMQGVIVCPNCQHEFFLNSGESIESVRSELKQQREELEKKKAEYDALDKEWKEADFQEVNKEDEIDAIDKDIKARNAELKKEEYALDQLNRQLNSAQSKAQNLKRDLVALETRVGSIEGKIDVLRDRMFGEVHTILDNRVATGNSYIAQSKDTITFIEGQIAQYRASKQTLIEAPETDFEASLVKSLNEYKKSLKTAKNDVDEAQEKFDELKKQELHFVSFKSFLARKKIDALSLIVNDFLEKIGSDIRLRLEGFTMTKTGKLRDKISVQVMRDGIDCGSYHKFSGGEKARLNLACILSLHTLTNSNCEDGKGLDFIIIDELLDKSDEVGMATYCEALNKLKQTALLITQGGVAEGYPHKLLITKRQGVSTLNN